uniref:Orf909 n=1 Tax=Iphiteon panicea TaxID=436082 RepID=A6YHK0_9METZ|nr:orf909 [Iphiteon panicea]
MSNNTLYSKYNKETLIQHQTIDLLNTHHKHPLPPPLTLKKKKIILSSLLNNYTYNHPNITHTHSKYGISSKKWIEKTLKSTEEIIRTSKRSTVWLSKTYDTNSLYPWSSHQNKQVITTKLFLQEKEMKKQKHITFTTYNKQQNSKWIAQQKGESTTHYKLALKTSKNNIPHNTLQIHLKELTNNTIIKKMTNKEYGKLIIQTMDKQNKTTNTHNTTHMITTVTNSKNKIQEKNDEQYSHKNIDSNTTHLQYPKKSNKNKPGYQKNEALTTSTDKKDRFSTCNTIIHNTTTNSIHIQTHSSIKH